MEKKKAFLKVFCLPVIFILISASSVNAKNEASVYVSDKYGNQIATASGIVEKDGIVRTNCRIISKWLENLDYTLVVKMNKNAYYPIENVISYNCRKNIVLLKIEPKPLPAAEPDKPEAKPPSPAGTAERVENKPESAEIFFQRGNTYSRSNKNTEAIEAYKQAIEIKPDHAEAYVNLGLAYYKLGRYAEAIAAYKQAVRIKPEQRIAYSKLGTAYILIGAYPMALTILKKASEIDPGNSMTQFNLGLAYFLNEDIAGAKELYKTLRKLDMELANKLLEFIN